MAAFLVVVHPFEDHKIGDAISEEPDIVAIVQGAHGNRVVRVVFPASNDDQIEDN